jgi:hypothetical protein
MGFDLDSAPRSENENRRHLAVDGWWCRNGEVPIAGDLRPRTEAYQSTTVSGSGWVSARGSASDRRRRPPRSRSRPSVPGHGFGPERCGVPGTPRHRPAVAFGAGRASAPARRPAVARGVCPARVISATSGRLDGLRGGCDALLRYAIPEGAPLENVPLPARRDTGTFSRYGTPAGSRILVLSGARDSRAPGCTRRGESAMWVARGPRERCQATAGRVSVRRFARPFQRRLAPPRALRKTSFGSSAPGPVSPLHRPAVAFGAGRASAPARRPAVA